MIIRYKGFDYWKEVIIFFIVSSLINFILMPYLNISKDLDGYVPIILMTVLHLVFSILLSGLIIVIFYEDKENDEQ